MLTARHLLTPREVSSGSTAALGEEIHNALRSTLDWIQSYVCQPHPQLGRGGTVCPYVPEALQRGLVWLSARPDWPAEPKGLTQLVSEHGRLFLQLEPTHGDESLYKTIVVVLSHIPANQQKKLVDSVHRSLKPSFADHGLMLGEFYPACRKRAIHNHDMFPLRSPVPVFVIRYMTKFDLPFLDDNEGTFRAYSDRFGHNVAPSLRGRFQTASKRFTNKLR